MSGTEVLCAGRVYCDLVFNGLASMPRPGTEVFAENLGVHAGGGAFITAAAFSALGRPAGLWGTLPAEPFGTLVLDEVEAAGVDHQLCMPAAPGSEPQVTVAIVADDDRAFLTRAPGNALHHVADLHGPRHLHIAELRTLQEHPDLLDVARHAGMTLSLDCGWDDSLTDGVADLIAAVDVFLPNEAEAARLESLGLLERPATLTVIKRGAKGATAISAEGRVDAAGHAVAVRDRTGAGDAFNAGFLDRWLAGDELVDCLALGNACGAATAQGIGGTGGTAAIRGLRSALLDPAASVLS